MLIQQWQCLARILALNLIIDSREGGKRKWENKQDLQEAGKKKKWEWTEGNQTHVLKGFTKTTS